MLRLLRFIIGAALVPFCVAATLAVWDVLRNIPTGGAFLSPEAIWFLTGYFIWLAMWFFLPSPVRVYVAAHELTHALWALLCGARVSHLKVTPQGGSVRLSKSNMLVTLAPYFFPLYTILIILIHWILSLFLPQVPYPLAWLFFIGLTWGFHVTFTVQSLLITQPDILEYGRLFSYTVIYLFNLVGVGLWLVCSTSVTLANFVSVLTTQTLAIYTAVYDESCARFHFVVNILKPLILKLLYYRG